MKASLCAIFAAGYGLATSVESARSLAAVHADCVNVEPTGRPQSRFSRVMASTPRGTSVVAGPVTAMSTSVIRVGSPGTTLSVTVMGVVARSTTTSISAENQPSAAAAIRVSSTASRDNRSRRSSVIAVYACQRTRPTARSSVALSGEGASTTTRYAAAEVTTAGAAADSSDASAAGTSAARSIVAVSASEASQGSRSRFGRATWGTFGIIVD